MIYAFVDVPKVDGEPALSLPAGVTHEKIGEVGAGNWPLRQVLFDPDGDGDGPRGFFVVLSNTPTRWIAWYAGVPRGLQWLVNNLGAQVVRADVAVRDNRTQLEGLGLTFDGDGNLLVPHAIAGQGFKVAPAAPE